MQNNNYAQATQQFEIPSNTDYWQKHSILNISIACPAFSNELIHYALVDQLVDHRAVMQEVVVLNPSLTLK